MLSAPVTSQSLANKDLDAFLWLWLPTQASMINPYFDKGRIDRVAINLEGAKYTLAMLERSARCIRGIFDLRD